MQKKNDHVGMKVGIVAGVATAAAAAAGAYWLYGAKNAAKHRKMAKSWMLKARADVMDAVEKVSHLDRATYVRIVDEIVKGYGAMKGTTAGEVARVARELKSSWKHMHKAGSKTVKKASTKKRTPAKKSAKRSK